jgi:hypothetical protein
MSKTRFPLLNGDHKQYGDPVPPPSEQKKRSPSRALKRYLKSKGGRG